MATPQRDSPAPRTGEGAPDSAARRPPFSANPEVGARGQRTQQRILDAALQAFGQRGYHQTGVATITELAGCSRASFYQYFASKEDVYRRLTGQVARQLGASYESLRPLTADLDGWQELRTWVGRQAEVYARYEPVFTAFPAAAETDEVVAPGAVRTTERNVARFRARLTTVTMPPRRLDPVIRLLLECQFRTLETARVLRSAAPGAYATERVEVAVTDVIHRTLFGRRDDVNVRPPSSGPPPRIDFGPDMQALLDRDATGPASSATTRRTREALLDAGRSVFLRLGYHRARIDDVVAAAAVSHGTFYGYFPDKKHLAEALGVPAIRQVSTMLDDIPNVADGGPEGPTALRRWLRRYNATYAAEAVMIRVWVDAELDSPVHEGDAAAAVEWGRRRIAQLLRSRGFGDVETEAVVMEALLSAFGARERSPAMVDAAAHAIERGLLGL